MIEIKRENISYERLEILLKFYFTYVIHKKTLIPISLKVKSFIIWDRITI